MKRLRPGLWLILGLCFWTWACVDTERNNPLESRSENLFIPQVLQPSGKEQWFPGMEREIRWRPATRIQDSVVTIQLICQGVSPESLTIAERAPNTGVYVWTVPDTPSPACRIRIIGSAGFSESQLPFRINPEPDLAPLGLEGENPAALREYVAFEREEDVWLYNRATQALVRLTDHPGFDGEPDWFKPNGNVLAYTSEQDDQKDIWMMGRTERRPVRVTRSGGEQPAWQSSFFPFPSLAYFRPEDTFTHIFTVTIDVPTPVIVPLPDSVGVSDPVQLTSTRFGRTSVMDIQALDWGSNGTNNVIIYATPTFVWRMELTPDFQSDVKIFVLNPELSPLNPALSLSGALVAFSADGDLWVKQVDGGDAIQMTYGEAEDDFPDWASETEIVFQRRETPDAPWTLWRLQVPPIE